MPYPTALSWVYPRVGGGNKVIWTEPWSKLGLSPRGRGKPDQGADHIGAGGSIPAWAGETGRPSG